jgi:hypothetical protein
MGLKLHINKILIGLRPMEVNESQYLRRFSPEYNKNAPEYDRNGNKQNSTLVVVRFSERIFQLLGSVNISYCVI